MGRWWAIVASGVNPGGAEWVEVVGCGGGRVGWVWCMVGWVSQGACGRTWCGGNVWLRMGVVPGWHFVLECGGGGLWESVLDRMSLANDVYMGVIWMGVCVGPFGVWGLGERR